MSVKVINTKSNLNFPPLSDCLRRRERLIKEVALSTFVELSATFAIILMTSPFIVTPMHLYVGYSLCAPIVNLALRILYACEDYNDFKNGKVKSISFRRFILNYCIMPCVFSINYLNIRILLHELGHAGMIALLCKDRSLRIAIEAFKRGSVQVICKDRSLRIAIEAFKRGSVQVIRECCVKDALIVAGGPVVDIIMNVGLLIAAVKSAKKRPRLAGYFLACSLITLSSNIECSLASGTSNDFMRLSKSLNVPPIVFTVCIVAIPVIVLYAMRKSHGVKTQ